jgi:hypothetical protein
MHRVSTTTTFGEKTIFKNKKAGFLKKPALKN